MRKTALGLAMFVGLAATITPSPGYAADAGTYETSIQGGIWRGNLAVDVAGNAIAVASDLFRYRHVNGHWSQQYHLPGSLGAAKVAAGRAGMAVVVGHSGSRSGRHHPAHRRHLDHPLRARPGLTARPRESTWRRTPTATMPCPGRSERPRHPDVRAQGLHRGAAAGRDLAPVRHGRPRHRPDPGGYRRRGQRHRRPHGAVRHLDPARLVARRKPVSGPAGATFQVSRAGDNVGSFDQIIERTGRRTYAYHTGRRYRASTSPAGYCDRPRSADR